MDGYRLALKSAHELAGCSLRRAITLVASCVCGPRRRIGIADFCYIVATLCREREIRPSYVNRHDAAIGDRPSSSPAALKPAPQGNGPTQENERKPHPHHPRPW